jgi:hypothetical protein
MLIFEIDRKVIYDLRLESTNERRRPCSADDDRLVEITVTIIIIMNFINNHAFCCMD